MYTQKIGINYFRVLVKVTRDQTYRADLHVRMWWIRGGSDFDARKA